MLMLNLRTTTLQTTHPIYKYDQKGRWPSIKKHNAKRNMSAKQTKFIIGTPDSGAGACSTGNGKQPKKMCRNIAYYTSKLYLYSQTEKTPRIPH